MKTLTVRNVPVEKLNAAPYNPRKMNDESFERLKRGLNDFGLVEPLVAREEDYLLIGGHQRLAAAKSLLWDTVPVVFISGLSDQQAAALNVLLNNPHAQGEWDMPKLSELLSTLDAEGFDATLTGFSDQEIEDLLAWQDAPDAGLNDTSGEDDEAFKDGDKIIVTITDITRTSEALTAITALCEEHPEWGAQLKEGRN